MTEPLHDLEHDHRLIERALVVLERAAELLERAEPVAPETLEQAREFVRGFADGCHHAKEEQGLFPVLTRRAPMLEAGPVRVLTGEHEMGRAFMRDLGEGIADMRVGKAGGTLKACAAIQGYTRLLREHIAKEEDVLFRVAERALTVDDTQRLVQHFERVEAEWGADAHSRYEALVEELEGAMGLGTPV